MEQILVLTNTNAHMMYHATNIQTILVACWLDMQKLTNKITALNIDNKINLQAH